MQAKVEVSYMEIYNEKVHDLLDVNAANGNGNKTAGLKVKFHRNLSENSFRQGYLTIKMHKNIILFIVVDCIIPNVLRL